MQIVKLSLLLLFVLACVPDNYQQIELKLINYPREAADFYLPNSANPSNKVPLFLFLHGYATNKQVLDVHLGLSKVSAGRQLAFIKANGIKDSRGFRYWNASGTCCTPDGKKQNDVEYLQALIEYTTNHYPVDPQQVYIVGYSNGAFMAYRMICEASELFNGIIAYAGGNYENYRQCHPSKKVKVLHVHGDNDTTIAFNGGQLMNFPKHIPIPEIVQLWANWDNCTAPVAPNKYRWDQCAQNTMVELIVRPGDDHNMLFSRDDVEGHFDKILK